MSFMRGRYDALRSSWVAPDAPKHVEPMELASDGNGNLATDFCNLDGTVVVKRSTTSSSSAAADGPGGKHVWSYLTIPCFFFTLACTYYVILIRKSSKKNQD